MLAGIPGVPVLRVLRVLRSGTDTKKAVIAKPPCTMQSGSFGYWNVSRGFLQIGK